MANNTGETYTCVLKPNEHKNIPLSRFYIAKNGIYSSLGHLPICKKCFEAKYNEYAAELHNPHLAMRRMCMLFDVYFNAKLFNDCECNIGKYFRRLNNRQYLGKTFDDSISEGEDTAIIGTMTTHEDEETEEGKIIPGELIEKWGGGLDLVDYENLEKHYDFLKKANPNYDSNQEIFILDLCYIKMQQLRAVRDGRVDDYNKSADSYRKTFTQAGLKTVRDASNDEAFTVGVTAANIEKYTPAEYYKNKKLFKDVEGIGEYLERFVLRPLRNLQHGTHDRDVEFCVKDDDDIDGEEEE
ncbi:MAG: hypothetical protein LUC91_00785 [Prevotella sp.]|nr:hypothetical protein [Prevotella sp.]